MPAIPHNVFRMHPPVETLEEYAFNRLSDSQLEPVEEHLLVCGDCQDKLREVDEYIGAMKLALAECEPLADGRQKARFTRNVWVPGAVVAAAVIVGIVFMIPAATAPESAAVELVAFRGGGEIARAAAAHRLQLIIDLADLPPSPVYRIQLVNSNGGEEWNRQAAGSGAKLSLDVPQGLKRGIHWVRISSAEGELLREFGVRAD